MPNFSVKTFMGELPRLTRRLLPASNSFQAWNCEIIDGDLRPTRYSVAEGTTWDENDPPETLQAYYDDTGTFKGWLSLPYWIQEFIVRPLPNDEYDRIYYLSPTGQLMVTDHASLSFNDPNGNRITITSDQPAGIEQPTPAPTAAVAAFGDSAVEFDATYVITYVDKYGAEGPASEASNLVTVSANGVVTVTNNDPSPPSNAVEWRIYRSVTGSNATDYQYVGEQSIGNPNYNDDYDGKVPGEVLPTEDWYPPEDGLQGLCHVGNGIIAAFKENTVYFCEQFLPNAWPPAYRVAVGADIIAICAVANSVIALTNSTPYVISGALPANPQSQKIPTEEACVSKKSVVTQGGTAVYASPNGISAVGLGNYSLLTEQSLTREQWEDHDPATIRMFPFRESILASYGDITDPTIYDYSQADYPNAGILILDPGNEGYLTYHEVGSDYGVTRPHDETFFWALWNALDTKWELYEFNPTPARGGVAGEYTWRSKIFQSPRPIAMSSAQVDAQAYPVYMRVWADSAIHWAGYVTNDRVFKLPPGKHKFWEFDVTGSTTVYDIGISTSVRELADQI